MKQEVLDWNGKKVGTIELSPIVFESEVRADIMARMVRYQLSKRRAGTHAVKNRSDVSRTGAKLYRQKGSGRARHGSARVNLFRGGGRSFGPHPRDHSISLQKKVRRKALLSALSSKASDGQLIVIEDFALKEANTSKLSFFLKGLGVNNGFFIDGHEVDKGFYQAVSNLPCRHVVSAMGANVYDILRREWLIISRKGVEALELRLLS